MDELLLSSGQLATMVGYLGESFGIGLTLGIVLFMMGYGVWMIIDFFRGGLT